MSNTSNFGLQRGTRNAMTSQKNDSFDCSTCQYPDSQTVEQVWGCSLDAKSENLVGINEIMPIFNYEGDKYRLDKLNIPGGRRVHAVGRGKPLHNSQESIMSGSAQEIMPVTLGERIPIDPAYLIPPVGCQTVDLTEAMGKIMERASDGVAIALEYATWEVLINGSHVATDPYGNPAAKFPYGINKVNVCKQSNVAVCHDEF